LRIIFPTLRGKIKILRKGLRSYFISKLERRIFLKGLTFLVVFLTFLFLVYPAFAVKRERAGSKASQGEILVGFKKEVKSEQVEKVKRSYRLIYSKKIPKINVYKFKLPKGKRAKDVIKELKKEKDVSFVETDDLVKIATTTPNDPFFLSGQQWGLEKINAPLAWDLTTGSASNVIAVLDTGVSTVHTEISSKLVSGYDFANGDSDASDDNGHGTAVAGIIAAVTNNATGIASMDWRAKIMPVKVMDASGSGYESDVADGIIWAADNGADIMNLSIYSYSYSPTLHTAINYALEKGCLLVAAAGNDGTSTVPFPAAFPGVIGVGASNTTDGVPYWSNYGSALDVIAPGVNIFSITTLPTGYISENGTSFSSPFVAGLASLLRSLMPTAAPAEIEYLIEETASRTVSYWDEYKGWGRIDAYSALVETTTSGYYDTNEPNDTVNQAVNLGSSQSVAVSSYIGRNSDTDFYSYTPSVSGVLTVSLTNIPSNCDYDIYLYGPGSQGLWSEIVTYSNNSNQQNETFSYSVESGKIYYIEVSSFYGFSTENYKLTLNLEESNLANSVKNDFDADLLSDIGVLYDYGNNQVGVWAFLSSQNYVYPTLYWKSGKGAWSWEKSKIVGGDFDGDSKGDIGVLYDYGNNQVGVWAFLSSQNYVYLTLYWKSGKGAWSWEKSKLLN
jgi:subtilisin family serine protease